MTSPDPLTRAQLAEAALARMEADIAIVIDNSPDTLDKDALFALWREINTRHMYARQALRAETDARVGAA